MLQPSMIERLRELCSDDQRVVSALMFGSATAPFWFVVILPLEAWPANTFSRAGGSRVMTPRFLAC